jgi:hypothetical protein
MSDQRICYQITSKDNATFLERVEFLFSKHMVFTSSRIKTVDGMRKDYHGEVDRWKVIRIGHKPDCKRVFNTDCYRISGKSYCDVPVKCIRFDKFVKEILPTL